MAVVYDAGALIAADRGDRRFLADHGDRLAAGVDIVVPAAVVGQVVRSPRQVTLLRMLSAVEVVPLDRRGAHDIGTLLAAAGRSDVVDASVVLAAQERSAMIVTADHDDIGALCDAASFQTVLLDP